MMMHGPCGGANSNAPYMQKALGLLSEDRELDIALEEATVTGSSSELRSLFVHILIYCEVTDPSKLWTKHLPSMGDDIPAKVSETTVKDFGLPDPPPHLLYVGNLRSQKTMVNSNTIVEDHWNSSKPSTNRKPIWYQSNNLGNTFRGKERSDFLFRKEKKEKEQELGTKIKQITESCKNMLRKKIEEIETYNSSIHRPFIKTYRCFHCNERGHYIRNCYIKKKGLLDAKKMAGDAKAVAEKEASKPVNINPNIYPTPTNQTPLLLYGSHGGVGGHGGGDGGSDVDVAAVVLVVSCERWWR
nr:ARID DNA-binding domain-containing protein [Tanacetum cinerariifolium]